MNNQLISIDDDVLDQVSGGGGEIVVGPGNIGGVVDGVAGGVKGTIDFLAGGIKALADLFPTISISWGKARG